VFRLWSLRFCLNHHWALGLVPSVRRIDRQLVTDSLVCLRASLLAQSSFVWVFCFVRQAMGVRHRLFSCCTAVLLDSLVADGEKCLCLALCCFPRSVCVSASRGESWVRCRANHVVSDCVSGRPRWEAAVLSRSSVRVVLRLVLGLWVNAKRSQF
jgi:hypothetical protein